MRFIHTSDWQLGMTRAFLTPEASARFAQARIDAVATLGRLAAEHEAKFIVVAGDVFESNQISRETLLRTLEALKSVPVPVFLLPGEYVALVRDPDLFQQQFPDVPFVVVDGFPGLNNGGDAVVVRLGRAAIVTW